MRGDTVFKRTYNSALHHMASLELKVGLPSENALAARLGTSRTTLRKILTAMKENHLIRGEASQWTVARKPKTADFFPESETVATSVQVEKKFMEWMMRGDRKEGDIVNGLELARQFNVSTGTIREYLNRFGRFGLIERAAIAIRRHHFVRGEQHPAVSFVKEINMPK